VIETGSPVVFTNTSFPAPDDDWARKTRHIRNMLDLFGPDGKLRASTAARLSATFPYVSPAARGYPCPATHIVDGGYYDNFGVTTAMGWLIEALRTMPSASAPHDVALLLIRPSPDADDKAGKVSGWSYQFEAPLDGIVNIRSDDQLRADKGLLALLQQTPLTNLCVFEFTYPRKPPVGCDRQPLSWKLTELQSACIDEAWDSEIRKPGTDLANNLDLLTSYLSTGKCPRQ